MIASKFFHRLNTPDNLLTTGHGQPRHHEVGCLNPRIRPQTVEMDGLAVALAPGAGTLGANPLPAGTMRLIRFLQEIRKHCLLIRIFGVRVGGLPASIEAAWLDSR